MQGLWVVPTPIGNLSDITLRGIEVLRSADVIWCEDTRHTRKLLSHYSIGGKLLRSYHMANERQALPRLFDEAQVKDWKVALVTDGGMPGIADPGFLAIREAYRRKIPVSVLPGPNAALTALVASGLPCDRFIFEGFMPRKGLLSYLSAFQQEERTVIWYESPHRIVRTINALADILGAARWAAVVRELSKIYEEVRRGPLGRLRSDIQANPPRGEVVLLLSGVSYQEPLYV
ncbi:MAG: 16S rRNA (cytidine(1402)-2'-O)-methyltransferase [Bacteroidia bacterium]|nr:16S rRNA (cytidine(1402)-2'-O)-methyltransferase [Bacteroidia bacterium]MDW8235528.1 16S rRNA (cytidine(1402)-2'-O)-methyltransferase [Bacteroidia bacterium]